MLFFLFKLEYSSLKNTAATWCQRSELIYLAREKQNVILLLWAEQALLLSACGHFTGQCKHWNGRGDWVFSWHAVLHPDATDRPVLEWPQLICLYGRRSVILPACSSKSEGSKAEWAFWTTHDCLWAQDYLCTIYASCSVLLHNWIIALPSNCKHCPKI